MLAEAKLDAAREHAEAQAAATVFRSQGEELLHAARAESERSTPS